MPRKIYKGIDLPSQLFPDRTVYNVDGSEPELPDDDDVISRLELCYVCGTVFDDIWKAYSRFGRRVCKLCLDTKSGPIGNRYERNLILDSEGNPAIDAAGVYAYGPEGEWIITGEQ